MTNHRLAGVVAGILGTAVGLHVIPAAAQTSQRAALAEITVTARKVEESLQDIPVAVSVVNEGKIEESGIRDTYELMRLMPNVAFTQSYTRTNDRPAIRGMGNIVGERTVGLFIDGVYIPGDITSSDIGNLERVEVLRGPQTALFGRGTLAGAINYVTRRPSAELDGRLSLAAGSEGLIDAGGYVSGPFDEAGRYRYYLSGRSYEYDGWYRNTGPDGGRAGSEQSRSVAAGLYLSPIDALDITLRASYGEDDDGIWATRLFKELNCFTEITAVAARGGYWCGRVPVVGRDGIATDVRQADFVDPGIERETFRSSLEIRVDIGQLELKSITALSQEEETWTYDDAQVNSATGPYRPGTPNAGYLARRGVDWDSKSQELHLSNGAESSLRWLIGAFWYNEERQDYTNIVDVRSGSYPAIVYDPLREVTNLAFFGRMEWDFATAWTLGLEGRYAEDELEVSLATGPVKRKFESFAPRVSFTWRATEDVTAYASYALGTRPGGINTGLFAPTVPVGERERLSGYIEIDEEEADNYELGVKAWLMDRRLYAEVTVFQIDWDKQALTTGVIYINSAGVPANISLQQNAGKTRIRGGELALSWQALESLTFTGTFGLADSEFLEFCDPTQVPLTGDCSVAGNQTPNTPETTASLSANHHLDLGPDWTLNSSVDYSYMDTRYDQVGNYAETGDQHRLNAQFSLAKGPLSFALWGKNLSNDRSASTVVRFFDPDTGFAFRRAFSVTYPAGRTWGGTVTYNF